MDQRTFARSIEWGAAALLALGLTACGAGGDGDQAGSPSAAGAGEPSEASAASSETSPSVEADQEQAPTLSEAWPETRRQLDEATSVRITGTMPTGRQSAEIDYRGQIDGSNYHTVVKTDGGDVVDVISDGEIAHAHLPDSALDRMGPPGKVKEMLDGQRVQQPESSLGVGVDILFRDITQNLPTDETWDGEDTEASVVEEDGQTRYRYEDTARRGTITLYAEDLSLAGLQDGPANGGSSAGASPSATGTASGAASVQPTFLFSEWNAVEEIPMPDEDETVSEDELVALIISGS